MSPSFAARLFMTLILCLACTELIGCPTGWLEFNKQCYFFGKDKTWWGAKDDCVSKGARLTSILDTSEQRWLSSARKQGFYWIGLSRENSGKPWQWADGTSFSYSSWSRNEPNNLYDENCVELYMHRDGWNDLHCSKNRDYICKMPFRPVCPTITTAKPVTCPTPAPCPTTTTAKPVTCPTPAPCPTTAKPATCPTPAPCPTTTKPATCPPCTTITTTKAAPCPTPAPCPTTTKPATCPAGPPPTDGELEMCAISTKEKACFSHNVTCSCLLTMTANPKGGFQGVLDGLSVARSIVIRGRSNLQAKRLVVNLDVRDASSNNATTVLQLNMDLESQTVTLNSRVGRKWGDKQTEDLPQGRPFRAGLPFKIVIKCGSGTFHLDLNDELQVDFTGPQLDIKRINLLEVWQVMLSGVQLM
nr:uncharacterized protein LOC125967714 isoform X2 [Syngnathus scovelli]